MFTQKKPLANPAAVEWRNVCASTRDAGENPSGTVDSRRIVNETGTTAAPSGYVGFDIKGAEKLVLKLKASTHDYSVKLWEWDASSTEWATNDTFGTVTVTAGTTKVVGVEVDGSHRAYVQVTAAGGVGQLDGWGRLILRAS